MVGGAMRHRWRVASAGLLLAIVAACGTAVSDEEAALELRRDAQATGSASGAGDDGSVTAGAGGDVSGADGATVTGPGAAGDAGGATASGGGEVGAAAGTDGAASGGGDPAAGGAPAGGAQGQNVSTGGATDVGVTPTEIRIGWVGTLTGPQPGLFKGALIGIQAWANYQNSRGGLMGRKITVLSGDDALDSGKNRAAHLQLKDKVFAFVGSFSINDDGGASVINECQCPDITGNLSTAMHDSPFHYGPQPAQPGWRAGPSKYYAQTFGKDVIEKTAFFYAQVGAAVPLAREQRRVYESNGFKIVYERAIPPNDNNQTADVVQMQRAGVRAVVFQGDITAITKLANAMRQQNFEVDLFNGGNAVYDSNTFKLTTPDALKNLRIDQVYAMFLGEDAGAVPEVKLFNDWMKKTDPNQVVDLFSMYGWLSGRLFGDVMTKMAEEGKTPVRKDLVEALKGWGTWDAYGMVAPVQIGAKKPADCFFVFTVTGDGKFQRTFPGDKTFECGVAPFSPKP